MTSAETRVAALRDRVVAEIEAGGDDGCSHSALARRLRAKTRDLQLTLNALNRSYVITTAHRGPNRVYRMVGTF